MRKTQQIHVADRRNVSFIKDFIRQGPAQTLSSEVTSGNGIDAGRDQPLCSGTTPTSRYPCAETSLLFVPVMEQSWGGEWEPVVYWTKEDIIAEVAPFDSPSHEYLEVESDWPSSRDGIESSGGTGILANGYSHEIWGESPFGSGVATTLNGYAWYGAGTYNRTLHNSLDDSTGYLPFAIQFDVTVNEIMDTSPSLGSGFRESAVIINLERLQWPIVYDPPFTHTETEAQHYHSLPSGSNMVTLMLKTPNTAPPTHSGKYFSVTRGASSDLIAYNWQEGHRYSVLVCVGDTVTRGKVWEYGEEEPSDYQVATNPSALTDWTPGLAVSLTTLTFEAGDVASGSSVGFHFFRGNPIGKCIGPDADSADGALTGGGCEDVTTTGSGLYMDRLVPKAGYWVPVTQDVSYYKQVYFDGLPVTQGVHYWMDGLKIYPNDPAIFSTTVATAEVVVR